MMKRKFAYPALMWVVACGPATTPSRVDFDLGGANDPVVKAALTSGSTTTTLNITIRNNLNKDYGDGVLTFVPMFTLDAAPSTALTNWVTASSKDQSVNTFIKNAGLTLNVDVFKVPGVAKNGGSQTVSVVVPTGSQLYYIARVPSSDADFVAMGPLPTSSVLSRYTVKHGVVSSSNSGNSDYGGGTVVDPSACTGSAAMGAVTTLFDDEMAMAANDPKWPMTAGYDAEFNGEWYTDGISARVANTGAGLPLGAITGFVKFLSVCPTSGATISLWADVDTAQFSATSSDTTLHVYYFDASNNVLKIDYGYPLQRGSLRRLGLYDSVVPSNARKIGLVPMAHFDGQEKSSVFYHNLKAVYEPAGTVAKTSLSTDDFSKFDATTKQPGGWSEFNGDWYVIPANAFATLWNPKWGGDQSHPPPVDTGLVKTVALGTWAAGDTLDATVFSASTFTDKSSFVRLRLVFNNGVEVASDRTGLSTFNDVQIRRTAIPTGATSVQVIVNVFLGANETSSLYVDDLRVSLNHAAL